MQLQVSHFLFTAESILKYVQIDATHFAFQTIPNSLNFAPVWRVGEVGFGSPHLDPQEAPEQNVGHSSLIRLIHSLFTSFHFCILETLICVTEPFQPQANYPKLHSINIVSLEMKPRVVSWHVRPGVHLFNPTQCLRHTTLRSNLTDLATSTGMKGRRKNQKTVKTNMIFQRYSVVFSFDFSYGLSTQKI